MSLRVVDSQLFFDCSHMTKPEFHRVYSSWFNNWGKRRSDNIYIRVREYIVENLVYIPELKKSRKNRDDRPEPKKTPEYQSFQI